MKYNVKYFDVSGAGLKYTEEVYLEREPADEKELKGKLKSEIIKTLKNIPEESDIEIVNWSKI